MPSTIAETESSPPSQPTAEEQPSRPAITLVVANQKGGVGKTTTTINLAAALGAYEKRVLIVDCDPQGNASRGFGLMARTPHLYHVMAGEAAVVDAILPTSFAGVSVLPADRELVGIEVEFVGIEGWEKRLDKALGPVRDSFDYILLDCPPSLGHLTVSALVASEGVVVPLQSEYFALEGISELVATVRRVQARMNPDLEIAGVLLTMYDDRTNLSRDVAAEARRHFADKVFDTVVPRNIRLAEAPSHGMPILQYDIKSRGSLAYLAVARELLARYADKARRTSA